MALYFPCANSSGRQGGEATPTVQPREDRPLVAYVISDTHLESQNLCKAIKL